MGVPRKDTQYLSEMNPDPMRRRFLQAYTWLGYYEGPINGLITQATQQAQQRYYQP